MSKLYRHLFRILKKGVSIITPLQKRLCNFIRIYTYLLTSVTNLVKIAQKMLHNLFLSV